MNSQINYGIYFDRIEKQLSRIANELEKSNKMIKDL